jgi:hypothetical protein
VTRHAGASSTADLDEHKRKLIELVTVVILGVATVASAWCAYQSSRWNDVETSEARDATDLRVEQSRVYSQATTTIVYDSTVVAAFAAAVSSNDTKLQNFFRQSLIRDGFKPVLERWRVQLDSGTAETSSLLEDQEYIDELFGPSAALDAEIKESSVRATEAGSNADGYLLTTLFMASALFFAGVVSSFKSRSPKVLLLMGAVMLLAVGAARIIDLPIA